MVQLSVSCCVSSGQWGEPGGLFEDTPMPEVPMAQDVGEGSSAVGKPAGEFIVLLLVLCFFFFFSFFF